MASETDHYRVLQVDPSADLEVIQAAYRVLARRFHPDHAGNDAAMKRLNAAWEVLQDPNRRSEYDRKRSSGQTSQEAVVTTGPKRGFSENHAGPPPGRAFGTVLTYGRYEGWSLGQIATVDPEFLEWLMSVPGGRYLRPEIVAIMREVRGPVGPDGPWGAASGRTAQRMKRAGVLIG
jgi:curved DNA-binding protein CbpA